MVYNDDATWADLSKLASQAAANMIANLIEGKALYDKFQSFKNGRTNAQMAVVLAKTEAQVADLSNCFAVLNELYNAADNQATYTGDRFYSLRKFS